jgi:hypothetical protein
VNHDLPLDLIDEMLFFPKDAQLNIYYRSFVSQWTNRELKFPDDI